MEDTTLLRLDGVEICRDENVILHDASFTLCNGEFVYVIGKVGSGKSSLLKSLYCEIPISQGDAWLLDYNLCKMKARDCVSGFSAAYRPFGDQKPGVRIAGDRLEEEERDKGAHRRCASPGGYA